MVEKIQQDMECEGEGEREKAITKKERQSKCGKRKRMSSKKKVSEKGERDRHRVTQNERG